MTQFLLPKILSTNFFIQTQWEAEGNLCVKRELFFSRVMKTIPEYCGQLSHDLFVSNNFGERDYGVTCCYNDPVSSFAGQYHVPWKDEMNPGNIHRLKQIAIGREALYTRVLQEMVHCAFEIISSSLEGFVICISILLERNNMQ